MFTMNPALAALQLFLFAAFIALFAAGVWRKIYADRHGRRRRKDRDSVAEALGAFIDGSDDEYGEGSLEFILGAFQKGGGYLAAADEHLLEILEDPKTPWRKRLCDLAERLGYHAECLAQIRSRNCRVSALGARRAGLYGVVKAVGDMEAALDTLSSENQFEILMAFARLGDARAMRHAFEKIKKNVLVNERGIVEILAAFPAGEEKRALFRSMIRGGADDIGALFLRAAEGEMVAALMDDYVGALRRDSKDIKAAALHGLAALGEKAPPEILIQALEDKDWEVRALAAKALGPVAVSDASSALYKALYDRHWWVRQNAAIALTDHPGYEALFVLAAESGDEYAKDSIVSALENGVNPVLLRSLKVMAA